MRPVEIDDTEPFIDVCGEYDIVKMTASWSWPVTKEVARERFCNALKFDPSKRLTLAILHDDGFIGLAGLGIKDDTDVHKLGYMIGRSWWGRGLMTEAVKALCQHGFSAMNADVIEADHYFDNPASGRVLEKAGFVKIRPADDTYSAARQENVPGWHFRLTSEGLRM